MTKTLKRSHLVSLFEILNARCGLTDLCALCLHLDVDCVNLRGEAKADKATELINYLERRRAIPDLVKAGRDLCPDIPWPDVPTATEIDTVPLEDRTEQGWGDEDWNDLLLAIKHGRCTPILGASFCSEVLALRSDIAREWAADHGFPLKESDNLAQVAQFVAVKRNSSMRPGARRVLLCHAGQRLERAVEQRADLINEQRRRILRAFAVQ